MITILPLTDSKKKEQIFREIPDAEDNAEILVMCDAEEELGFVAVDVKSSTIRMLKMQLPSPEPLQYADSLMKAAASYGATVGAYQIESCIPELRGFFQSCGFRSFEGRTLCSLANFIKICRY